VRSKQQTIVLCGRPGVTGYAGEKISACCLVTTSYRGGILWVTPSAPLHSILQHRQPALPRSDTCCQSHRGEAGAPAAGEKRGFDRGIPESCQLYLSAAGPGRAPADVMRCRHNFSSCGFHWSHLRAV